MGSIKEKFTEKILETLANKIVYGGISVLAVFWGGGVSFDWFADPFYHSGWIEDRKAWLFLFLIVLVANSVLCFRLGPLVVSTGVSVLAAISFAILYNDPLSIDPSWKDWIWVLHGVLYALIPGVIGGWIIFGWRLLTKPPAPPATPKAPELKVPEA